MNTYITVVDVVIHCTVLYCMYVSQYLPIKCTTDLRVKCQISHGLMTSSQWFAPRSRHMLSEQETNLNVYPNFDVCQRQRTPKRKRQVTITQT